MCKFAVRTIGPWAAMRTTPLILLALALLVPWTYCQTGASQPAAAQPVASQAPAPTTTAAQSPTPPTPVPPIPAPPTTAPLAAATPAIVTTVDEVTLDMVVRDNKNKPVLDLKPDEFWMSDNGSIVKLSGLRLVKGASTADHLITFVFDRLEPSAANNARDIAGKILKMVPAQGFSFSVLSVQGRLRLFQGFTSDQAAVSKAIATITATVSSTRNDRDGKAN